MYLKRCPFCGSPAVHESFKERKGYAATVRCCGCPAEITTITYDTEKEAETRALWAWNRRVSSEAADAIEVLSKMEKTTQWIPVAERLPDDRRDVQITVFWHDAWRTMYGYYDGAFWHMYAPMHTEVADVEVIGWMEKPDPMPLPEPQKEEGA